MNPHHLLTHVPVRPFRASDTIRPASPPPATRPSADACLRYRLERQSALIETTLARYSPQPVAVTGGEVGREAIAYTVQTTAVLPLAFCHFALAAALDTPVSLAATPHGYTVTVTGAPPPVGLWDLLQLSRRTPSFTDPIATAVIGLDETGQDVVAPMPGHGHTLITGDAGSGKSSLLRTLVASLSLACTAASQPLHVLAVQGAGTPDLDGLNDLPAAFRLRPVITDTATAVRLLAALAVTSSRPLPAKQPSSNATRPSAPHRLIVIDDWPDLLVARDTRAPDELSLAPATALPVTLTEAVRSAIACLAHQPGTSLILAGGSGTDAMAVWPSIAWPTRFVGRVDDVAQAATATGLFHSGAEQLLGQGDFLHLVAPTGKSNGRLSDRRPWPPTPPRYFQAAYADRLELAFLLRSLNGAG